MNATEQMFAPQAAIPTENRSYTFGWEYCPEGGDSGHWMYVKGIDWDGQAFEHWSFMRHHDVKMYDTDPTRFFKTYRGIREVVVINRNLAWQLPKFQYRWGM